MYSIISNDIKEIVAQNFDVICFFTPGGVKSLIENLPAYKQNGTKIGAFGLNTFKAVEDAGLTLDIKAPQPQAPSMVSALEMYLNALRKK
jgi:uroporphyrinogen-III synthase